MLLWLLLVLATDRAFADADPLEVAKLSVRQNEWVQPGEVAWWLDGQRYLRLDPWIADMGLSPLWKFRMWFASESRAVEGVMNDLRIRRLKRESDELRKALAAVEWPLWNGGQ